jgi:hypothetical protein
MAKIEDFCPEKSSVKIWLKASKELLDCNLKEVI